jgi:hypothetical protein
MLKKFRLLILALSAVLTLVGPTAVCARDHHGCDGRSNL